MAARADHAPYKIEDGVEHYKAVTITQYGDEFTVRCGYCPEVLWTGPVLDRDAVIVAFAGHAEEA